MVTQRMDRQTAIDGFTLSDEDLTCPACGQPRGLGAVEREWETQPAPSWPWLLLAVGIYLGGVFGRDGWRHAQAVANQEQWFRTASGSHLTVAQVSLGVAQGAVDQAAAGVALALLVILVGLSALARRRLRPEPRWNSVLRSAKPVAAAPADVSNALLDAWKLAETLGLCCVGVFLVCLGFILVAHLLQGADPSLDLVNQAARDTVRISVEAIVSMRSA